MADAADQSTGAPDASAEAPVETKALDLDSIVKPLIEHLDERFSGFQSTYDKKQADIVRQINDLKTAGLSPEEQEQVAQQTANEELQRLRAENAMLTLGKDQPDAVAFFQEIMSQDSLESQLAVIQARLGKKAADQVEQATSTDAGNTAETEASGADANNPARRQEPSLAGYVDGQPMTAELAKALMDGANQPGSLVRAREG